MHLPIRALRLLPLVGLFLGAPAEAARVSPACAGLAQKAAALPADDPFQANLILFPAAAAGCADLVGDLLDRGAAIEARDRLGRTALALAAKEGRKRVAELLIAHGAAINARAISGATPLFFAAEADHSSVAKDLVGRGADPNLRGAGGLTPLMAAAFNGNVELSDLFLATGADPDARDGSGKTAIIYAAARGFGRVVAQLIEAKADINHRDEHELTPLMWAAGYPDGAGIEDIKQVVALLIARGAAIEARDDRGLTAHEIARNLGHQEIADYLAKQGAAR
jgi:ankyrin repeat protein